MIAAAASRRLAKLVGEATELILKLQSVSASSTLVEMLSSALKSLKEQYSAVTAFADAKVEDSALYEPYRVATDKIIAYYESKKQFANALIRVGKSQSEPAQAKPKAVPKSGA